jgi:hypothetical protein
MFNSFLIYYNSTQVHWLANKFCHDGNMTKISSVLKLLEMFISNQ